VAVPKSKISKSRRGMRRSANSKIAKSNAVENKTTGELVRPHHVTLGKKGEEKYYNGRVVTTAAVNA
jgi:large subunit ribosomal protein L32